MITKAIGFIGLGEMGWPMWLDSTVKRHLADVANQGTGGDTSVAPIKHIEGIEVGSKGND